MLRRALNRNLHEEPVVPTPPESVALRQQLFEVSDGLNYGPPALGHRDRLGGRETLKVHQTDDSCEIESINETYIPIINPRLLFQLCGPRRDNGRGQIDLC